MHGSYGAIGGSWQKWRKWNSKCYYCGYSYTQIKVCTESQNKNTEPKDHVCTKNFERSIGGMEVAEDVQISKLS